MNRQDRLNLGAIRLGLSVRLAEAEDIEKKMNERVDGTNLGAYCYGVAIRAREEQDWLKRMLVGIDDMIEETEKKVK